MNNLLNNTKKLWRRHGSTVLTVVGGVGVVATAVMAVKATPKALLLMEEAKKAKGEELTKFEKIKVAAPYYIPATLVGASTIACIFGANMLNKKQQAALMSAYALLDNSYKDYRKKVKDMYGDEADMHVKAEVAKDNYETIEVGDDKQLFYDMYSERYFESTMEKVLIAEYEINRLITTECSATLNQFYDALDIERKDYGDYIGWDSGLLHEMCWYSWIDFENRKVVMDDGLECYLIIMGVEPMYEFDDY